MRYRRHNAITALLEAIQWQTAVCFWITARKRHKSKPPPGLFEDYGSSEREGIMIRIAVLLALGLFVTMVGGAMTINHGFTYDHTTGYAQTTQ